MKHNTWSLCAYLNKVDLTNFFRGQGSHRDRLSEEVCYYDITNPEFQQILLDVLQASEASRPWLFESHPR